MLAINVQLWENLWDRLSKKKKADYSILFL